MQARPLSPSHTPIHPNPTPTSNKPPQQVILTPKEFKPEVSATWKALQESEPNKVMDPAKTATHTNMKEHEPVFSGVYSHPKLPVPGQNPPPRTGNDISRARSPVAEFLPPQYKASLANAAPASSMPMPSLLSPNPVNPPPPKVGTSAVQEAAMAEGGPVNLNKPMEPIKIPLFETNAIGGRKKIAQTASFNRLMMDVLGE